MATPINGSSSYPEASHANVALILGILGLVLLGIPGPFAFWIGSRELRAIDAGRRPPENRGRAKAARVLGRISTLLLVVILLALS